VANRVHSGLNGVSKLDECAQNGPSAPAHATNAAALDRENAAAGTYTGNNGSLAL
jgi:hypothetical protein